MEKNKKFKILAAADLHGDSRRIKKLAEKAEREKVDLVILAGDNLGFAKTPNVIKPFKDKHKKLLIVPGNWDSFATTDFLANFYGIKNIHGYSTVYENIGFFGAGGAEDAPGVSRVTEREMFQTLKKAHAGLKGIEKKIMITHMHSADSKSEFSGIPGSKSIRKAIKEFKPDLFIHGHIHEGEGIEEKIGSTRVVNVGREGRIIEI